ncbi:MAG: type II toxin-antitoxin system RelE/ParE family toxin [Acidobacteria bacterium]|nr:type II toxin-antitoxin system RelE/ParE family toxin [Acidobacteriota bacterium]
MVVFYRDVRGREQVREWLDELEQRNPSEYGTVRHAIDLLEEFGVHLSQPYSKQLEGKLRELRPGPWRITYFADPKRRLVLLTSFRKKGARADPREIAKATRSMDDWLRRTREEPT